MFVLLLNCKVDVNSKSSLFYSDWAWLEKTPSWYLNPSGLVNFWPLIRDI